MASACRADPTTSRPGEPTLLPKGLTNIGHITPPTALCSPHTSWDDPGCGFAFTFCSSSNVSWQHSQNPLFFFGTAVDWGLFSPLLCSVQPSTAL